MVEKIKIFNWENEFAGEKFDAIVKSSVYSGSEYGAFF